MPEIRFLLSALIINLVVSALFLSTLQRGKTPLITAIARIEHGGVLPADLSHYSRCLTAAWGGFMILLGMLQTACAWLSTSQSYGIIPFFANSFAIVLFFGLEFIWRVRRFRNHSFAPPWALWGLIRQQGGWYRLYRRCMN